MPTTLRRLFLTLLFPTVLIGALATAAIAGGNNEKVALCHVTGNGSSHQVNVSVNAMPAHLAHGDVLVDEYGECP